MDYFKKKIISAAEWMHLKIFGHKMGPQMRRFIGNLTWSFLTGTMVTIAAMGVNIFAGRLIGPEEYGKYNLVLVISSYLLVPIYLGLDLASVRAIAGSKDQKEAGQNISSTLTFIVFSSILVISLVAIFQKPIAVLFSTNIQLIKYMLFFTAFLVGKTILDCCVRGIKEFKQQFFGRFFETVVTVTAFILLFLVAKRLAYTSYINVLFFGATTLSIYYLISLKKYLVRPSLEKIRHQLSYGKFFALTAALTTLFVSLDKLLINRYLSPYDLGLYVAYYTVSVTMALYIVQMFNNVFFPSIAKDMNKVVFSKIEKLIFTGFIPIFAVIVLMVYVLMKILGKKYGIQLDLVIIFGLLGTIQIITNIYYSIILTFEKRVYKKYLLYSNLVNLSTIIIYVILLTAKQLSIEYIALALILNYLTVMIIQKRLIKSQFCDKVDA